MSNRCATARFATPNALGSVANARAVLRWSHGESGPYGPLFASREYVRRHGQPQKLADLANHDCVLFRGHGGKMTWHLRDGEHQRTIEVTGPLEVDEVPSAHQAIVAGVGIGLMSFFVSSRMRGLVRILPRYTSANIPVSIVSPSKRLEPARVVLLRDSLVAQLMALRWRG